MNKKKKDHKETILFFLVLVLFMTYAWFRMDFHYDKALKGTKLQQQRTFYLDKSAL